jgi:long-chain acyl-CoA synthetase
VGDRRRAGGSVHRNGDSIFDSAPNQPAWVAAALGVLVAGGVLVPLADMADINQVVSGLKASGARLLLTCQMHLDAAAATLDQAGVQGLVLEQPGTDTSQGSVKDPLDTTLSTPSTPHQEDPAALLATSGTTGAPKTFLLSHRNIGGNVQALDELGIIGPNDRVLLPLPLHHAYPLIVGMLTTLTAGSVLVLPAGATGPAIMRAAREGRASIIVGVPKLYDAIVNAIDTRLAARSLLLRVSARALLLGTGWVQRTTRLALGRILFAPVRRSIAPSLRLLVSGGARLERSTEERLEALGWQVSSGDGLAETASIFTGNRPDRRRPGSAGLPLGEGLIRIAQPDSSGIGEILLKGPSVTAGYIDNPEALERVYAVAPQIQEIAILERDGALVALVRPDHAKLREMGATNIRDGTRVVLAERARDLPSHERLSGFALTDEPLPRTRARQVSAFPVARLVYPGAGGTPYARAASTKLGRPGAVG